MITTVVFCINHDQGHSSSFNYVTYLIGLRESCKISDLFSIKRSHSKVIDRFKISLKGSDLKEMCNVELRVNWLRADKRTDGRRSCRRLSLCQLSTCCILRFALPVRPQSQWQRNQRAADCAVAEIDPLCVTVNTIKWKHCIWFKFKLTNKI
jgi:hypothetical protein